MSRRESRRSTRIQTFYYRLLFVMIAVSVGFFFLQLSQYGQTIWKFYYSIYMITALAYTWYVFVLLFWGDAKQKPHTPYAGQRISVVIPCYNENLRLLKKAITSVVNARGNKEIILIDDGSTNNIREKLLPIAKKHGIILHFFDRNQGKRVALHYAVTHLIRGSKYVVTMDSDTVLDRNALIRIVEPLQDPTVAAVSGDVRLSNEKQNLLTRMIGSYYWSALHIHRKAESTLGMVSCCSGALSAYRSNVLRDVIEQFVRQEFFGERCTHSEDRHLTNLMHKHGHRVVFTPDAIAYTNSPSTVIDFLKQQQRWRRGFLQEALFTMTFAWKNKPVLFLQTFVWELILPFLSVGILLLLLLTSVTSPLYFVTTMAPSLLFVSLIKNLPALFLDPRKLFGLMAFTVFAASVSHIQGVYALFTVRNKSWITR